MAVMTLKVSALELRGHFTIPDVVVSASLGALTLAGLTAASIVSGREKGIGSDVGTEKIVALVSGTEKAISAVAGSEKTVASVTGSEKSVSGVAGTEKTILET